MKLFHLYLGDSLAPPVDFLLCTCEDLAEYLNTDQPDKGAIERTARHFGLYRHRVSKTLVNKGILGRESLTEWVELPVADERLPR